MQDELILDVSANFEEFRREIKPLVANFPEFANSTLTTILEFIQNEDNAEQQLNECAAAVEEALGGDGVAEPMPAESVEVIKEQVFRLAEAIYHNLKDVGAYDRHGMLGFKFKEILGKDIVLEPMAPEDFGTPAEEREDDEGYDPYQHLVEDDE